MLNYQDALKRYHQLIQQSYHLYLFNLLQFSEVAGYAKQDAANKSSKFLPSEDDKKFTAKLAENDLLVSLSENPDLKALLNELDLLQLLDDDSTRRIYHEFSKTPEYKSYIDKASSGEEDHREILILLFKHCINSESYNDLIEDNFPYWVDDKSLVIGAVKKTIKGLPVENAFFELYKPSAETTIEFGEVLFNKVFHEDEELLNIIEPTLKNWDVDRVAIIDMILLKMALCELMNFPTIPTKVTLNEFVEISKQYSTEKSKDFINGILDRLMKKLEKEGKILKEGRGLME